MKTKDRQKEYQKIVKKLTKIREKKNISHLYVSVTTGWSLSFVEDFEALQTLIASEELLTYAEAIGKKVRIKN